MAVPTTRQQHVIALVRKHCEHWVLSTDIHAPVHEREIDSDLAVMELAGDIDAVAELAICEALYSLLRQVRGLDACPERTARELAVLEGMGVAAPIAQGAAGLSAAGPRPLGSGPSAPIPNATTDLYTKLLHQTRERSAIERNLVRAGFTDQVVSVLGRRPHYMLGDDLVFISTSIYNHSKVTQLARTYKYYEGRVYIVVTSAAPDVLAEDVLKFPNLIALDPKLRRFAWNAPCTELLRVDHTF